MDEQLEANRYDDLPKLDAHWNYRVVRRVWEINGEIEEQFGIHEVYYREGKPEICSERPDGASGESLEALKKDMENQQLALKKPVVDYEDIGK